MEGLGSINPFASLVAQGLRDQHFTLLDIGCSGGIDTAWRSFGERLRAFGFDPNLAEVDRLSALETSSSVRYVPGFVGIPKDHPFSLLKADKPDVHNVPWGRLSVAESLRLQQEAHAKLDAETQTKINLWSTMKNLADPQKPIIIADFLEAAQIDDVDFVKIDVDGADFTILNSLKDVLSEKNVLGVGIEINFCGSDAETDNTFHNIDRFMRACGFDLFNLWPPRHYSAAALPSPFLYGFPAQSLKGRVLQSDALYARDLFSERSSASYSPAKKAKLAALFAMTDLPDCAAEILIEHRADIEPILDVDNALNMLTEQIRAPWMPPITYNEYMAAFQRNDEMFFHASRSDYPDAHPEPHQNPQPGPEDEELASLQGELKAARQELEAAKRDAARARLETDAVRASTSWRITAPLRWLSKGVRNQTGR